MKEILHNYKFNKRRRLRNLLSEIVYNELRKHKIGFNQITPVPMNRVKMWKRGFNQSELISRDLSKKLNLPFKILLKEEKHSITQRNLGYRDRFINILNRYKVINSKIVRGKKILIIDDIFTTGATINECARVLLDAGALEIFSLTIARAGIKKLEKI